MRRKVVQIERPFLHFAGNFLRFFRVDGFSGAFHQRDNIAHAQNAVGNPVRVEFFQSVNLFAGADQLDGLAGDSPHGQRSTTAAIAINPGQHDAGDRKALIKGPGHGHSVLPGERISHQQNFMRVGDLRHFLIFRHQLFINMQPACRIENEHVIAASACLFLGAFSDLIWILAGDDLSGVHTDLLAKDFKLLLRCRTAHIERSHQHLLALAIF